MNSIIYLGIDVHTTNFTFCALSVTLGEAPKVIAENQTEADGICALDCSILFVGKSPQHSHEDYFRPTGLTP